MDAKTPVTGSAHSARSDDKVTSTEVLIIGLGLSAIPLIRELEKDGIEYVIVSQGQSIWERLEQHGRLDFDLVSSLHTSLYSFELVKRDPADRYPPSKEYAAFIRSYVSKYKSKVVDDRVASVENHSSYSVVRTQGGRVFETKHLIVSTAFRRRMNSLLNEFDYASARNKTIAITAMGDSVNLMISKLIPRDNRIILVTNGFVLLDKLSLYDGVSYTLDQLEYHNLRHVSKTLYANTIVTGMPFVWICAKLLARLSVDPARFLPIANVYAKHPLAIRDFKMDFRWAARSPVPNGIIAIKYWPIDAYQALFDNESLKQTIKDGYLLNDITFFLEHGLAELWPKAETVIDREAGTIRWKDKVVKCDHILDADNEVPNLPDIVAYDDGSPPRTYEYVNRNCFMGIVPKELRHVYFIGYTRPTTGGLNNIIEMQCLFTHKMIADPDFNRTIYEDIEGRIRKYDRHYRLSDERTLQDHLVHYGFYTEDIARLLNINPRLRDCRSLRDLAIHFIYPNTAFKFRQEGPYKVEGVKEMVRTIFRNHRGFSVVAQYVLTYALLQLTAYLALILAWYHQSFYFPTLALPVALLVALMNPVTGFVAANGFGRNSYVNVLLAAALAVTVFYPYPVVPTLSLVLAGVLTYVLRKLGWSRVPFNDLRTKKSPKYVAFFKRYCDAFKQVFADAVAPAEQR
jgi:hypothetical protein